MAVSFAASSLTLSTWGFSDRDIAVIAGASRAIGTWVTTQLKDQALLQFMKVDPEDLIPREGLIDPTALHQRWDVKLTLLQNGRRRTIGNLGSTVAESMPKFSWFMTLVISGLDAALGVRDVRKMTTRLLTRLFTGHVDGMDYLLRELPHHTQGWESAACVRNILAKARKEWGRWRLGG